MPLIRNLSKVLQCLYYKRCSTVTTQTWNSPKNSFYKARITTKNWVIFCVFQSLPEPKLTAVDWDLCISVSLKFKSSFMVNRKEKRQKGKKEFRIIWKVYGWYTRMENASLYNKSHVVVHTRELVSGTYSKTVSQGQVPCAYTRGELLQGQFDMVFDWFIFLFGRRNLSHGQYTRGDKHNLRWQVPETCPFNSNQFEFMGQYAMTRLFHENVYSSSHKGIFVVGTLEGSHK